ncbi:MAG: hypothetical protein JRI49_07825 [Deltaproteobacteria bacterium]|nr:hypothetical protein [Deltaproteobacteria bacterium]
MQKTRHSVGLSLLFLLGVITLGVAGVIFWFLLPYLTIIFVEDIMLAIAFLIIYIVTLVALFVGVMIYYAIRHPMRVKKGRTYSIEKTKEAGRREKGET